MDTKLKPWIGETYNDGGLNEKRLLILGESCYGFGKKMKNNTVEDMIESYAANYWNHRYFTNIMQIITGKNKNVIDRWEIWNKVAFYEYIQRSLKTSGISPTDKDFNDSIIPFKKVLNRLKPTHVLALSKRLWLNLSPSLFEAEKPYLTESKNGRPEIWKLKSNTNPFIMPLPHPSRASSEICSKYFRDFIKL